MPFDIHDESLLRWHLTNIAQSVYGWTRRESEVFFRDSYDYILKKMRKATTRDGQFTVMHKIIESAEDEMSMK